MKVSPIHIPWAKSLIPSTKQESSKYQFLHVHLLIISAKVGIVITGSNKAIMFPLEMKKSRHETFVFSGGNTANSTTVTFYDDHQPLYLDSKSELQVWYGEALRNRHAHDNSGKTCADVSVLFAKI